MRAVFFAATTFLLIGGALVLTAVYQLVNTDKPVEGVQVASAQPAVPVFNMSFADTTENIDLSVDIDLRGLLPEAPEGWFRKDFVIADGEKLIGAEVIRSAVRKSDANSMILKFEVDAKNTAGHAAYTYMRGDRLILVRARVLEVPNSVASSSASTELLGQDAAHIHSLLRPRDQLDLADLRFAFKDGIVFYQRPPFSADVRGRNRGTPGYRTFRAAIGRVEFEIASNASDVAIAKLIEQMDLLAIHAQLGVSQSSGFAILAAEPLSNQPPPERSAYVAASELLTTETNLSRVERDLLRGIADGRFLTRARIERELDGAEMPATIVRFLRHHQLMLAVSEHPAFMERQAASLIHHLPVSPRASIRSFMALHFVANGEITNMDDYRRLLGDPSGLHPKVKDFLLVHGDGHAAALADNSAATDAALPVFNSGSSTASSEQGSKPVVRRGLVARTGQTGGGSCTIEKGVRRCVVGGN